MHPTRSRRRLSSSRRTAAPYMSRLIRLTLSAPGIIEALLDGREPDEFSQTKLTGAIPAEWEVQREKWGFVG